MFIDQRPSIHQDQEDDVDVDDDDDDDENIREIHALTSPLPPPPLPSAAYRPRGDGNWETTTGHHRSSSLSAASTEGGENFTTMSREFNALVLAGTEIDVNGSENSDVANSTNTNNGSNSNLERIGEEDMTETNPLAIVPDNNPLAASRGGTSSVITTATGGNPGEVSVQRVKKEEVESKISAWQNAKISKINNRFKRDDAIINGWENEQVQKSSSWMKKVERKLEEKRARAMEKMQNDIAKARRKAEERRATAEAKRGTKVARVLEVANLMRVVGRAPAKRSFF